ncbi:MAG: orotidine 5'-phosphate decarboxylase [Desulfurococcales archaeon]|nr:orotidine 5'-phosphate decarboxylase [Desulfurococcales archaeon]
MDVPGRLGRALEECGRLLQVALDFTNPWDALRVALQARAGRGVILEAGTPLIKSYGMGSVRLLRVLQGEDGVVVADTKTMDTGRLELSLAAEAGADVATVLAVAPRETIREMVEEGETRGVAVMGDLIGHPDPVRGAEELYSLGVHVALFHIGIDVQRSLGLSAANRAELVAKLAESFPGPIAVAGGIKPEEVGRLVEAGARIIIIGGAITRSPDPASAAMEAYRGLNARCL